MTGGQRTKAAVYIVEKKVELRGITRNVVGRVSRFERTFLANNGPEFSGSRGCGLLCFSFTVQSYEDFLTLPNIFINIKDIYNFFFS